MQLFALFLVFLVLKLTEVINWSWWWITAPLWGGFVLLGLIIGVALMFPSVRRSLSNWRRLRK